MRPVEQTSIRQTAASSREPREGKPRGEKGLIFHTLKQIADAIVATFPRAFEVVVHDLSQPQKSIKYIAGDVTRRKVGGPVTDLLVKALHQEKGSIRDRLQLQDHHQRRSGPQIDDGFHPQPRGSGGRGLMH